MSTWILARTAKRQCQRLASIQPRRGWAFTMEMSDPPLAIWAAPSEIHTRAFPVSEESLAHYKAEVPPAFQQWQTCRSHHQTRIPWPVLSRWRTTGYRGG